MANNTQVVAGTGDVIRDLDRTGVKTQIIGIDVNIGGAESLMSATVGMPTVPLAGENHVGNVSTPAAVIVTQAPAVTVGTYATGNVVGGLLTFAGAARVAGLDGLVQQVVVFCKTAQTTAFDLIMFHTNPAASTFTDKTALAVNVADFDKIIGVAHITDWTNLGGASVAQALNLAMPYKIAGGSTTAYGVLVARSAPTFASISDIEIALKVLPN